MQKKFMVFERKINIKTSFLYMRQIFEDFFDNIETEDIIEDNINNPKIVAIGEIGLDYYWVSDNKEEQKQLLIKQLDLAQKYNKPIVIHSRDAVQDIYNILKQYKLNL